MSIHTYKRALVGADWDIQISSLAKETKAALPGKDFKLAGMKEDITFSFADKLTAGEIVTLDATVATNKVAGPYPQPKAIPSPLTLRSPDGNTWLLTVDNLGTLKLVKA